MEKLQSIWLKFLVLLGIGYFGHRLFYRPIVQELLEMNSATVMGVVIDDKTYRRHDKIQKRFWYSVEYEVNDREYSVNSFIEGLRVGDSIPVEYFPPIPFLAEVVNANDEE